MLKTFARKRVDLLLIRSSGEVKYDSMDDIRSMRVNSCLERVLCVVATASPCVTSSGDKYRVMTSSTNLEEAMLLFDSCILTVVRSCKPIL